MSDRTEEEWTNEQLADGLHMLYDITRNAFALLRPGDDPPTVWDQAEELVRQMAEREPGLVFGRRFLASLPGYGPFDGPPVAPE